MDEVEKLILDLKCGNSWVRENAAQRLGDVGDSRAVPALIDALKDEEYDVRDWAVYALESIGDERSIMPLIEALEDEVSEVRLSACEALVRFGDPAIPGLIGALRKNLEHRMSVAGVLERIGLEKLPINERVLCCLLWSKWGEIALLEDAAVPGLVESLRDDDVFVRLRAVSRLGEQKDASAVPGLIAALDDKAHEVRVCASGALMMNGDSRAIPALVAALKDEHRDMRFKTALALEGILIRCETMEDLRLCENNLREGLVVLRREYPAKRELAGANMTFARLMRIISEKRNELMPDRDILLGDKPKPPKKGAMYTAARRVRNE